MIKLVFREELVVLETYAYGSKSIPIDVFEIVNFEWTEIQSGRMFRTPPYSALLCDGAPSSMPAKEILAALAGSADGT